MEHPHELYHGTSHKINGPLKPPVFATARKDIAALFMFPADVLSSIGFEKNIAYICIWGSLESFSPKDKGGFLYVLPTDHFEKIGKDYEWQNFQEVSPIEVKEFSLAIDGMIDCGVEVYFIDNEEVFDRIVADKDNRFPILRGRQSENQKRGRSERTF
jgi:hypothetical protein